MHDMKRLSMRVISPVDAGEMCRDRSLKVISNFQSCLSTGKEGIDCHGSARREAKRLFTEIVRKDASAIHVSSCEKLISLAGGI